MVYSEFSSWKVNHLRIVQRPTLRAGGHFLEWLTKRFVTADGHSFSTLSGLRGRSSGVKQSPPTHIQESVKASSDSLSSFTRLAIYERCDLASDEWRENLLFFIVPLYLSIR